MDQKNIKYRVYTNWAKFLGCNYSELLVPKVSVIQHSESLNGYNGFYCFNNGTSCMISAPVKYVGKLDKAVSGLTPNQAFDAELLGHSIGDQHKKIIGPAFQGYIDNTSVLQASSSSVVEYKTEQHRTLLKELRDSCSETDWQHSSIDEQKSPILLKILNKKIVAAGSWRKGESGFFSIGIISHPAHRGKGHAKSVVNALTKRGLSRGATMHYQTLESNTSSVAIAHSLGYERLGRTLAIRMS
ncbi:GNAT family N-acetyltransferase [Rossellomorea yichunensis]|uniref:GNAT family N-acetyltransferase n=1 Tax=Rossellomorea yichunensis TaxID=3077331 RepID=UPI0028DF0BC5|nr:GNAT family N-acetyltransferase [Rossellomorea sp. YC4-1]MDT9025114.1 GNAT family N-acetyltransferase [Rossellomorea sp. YC4-1]